MSNPIPSSVTQNLLVYTPNNSTTNSWLFPPQTEEVQFDEKWDFVYKKEKNCDENDPLDARRGDNWDHVALDAEHKLVLKVVNGKRTKENTKELVQDTAQRLGNEPPRLITSDGYKAYEEAILEAFGEVLEPARSGKPGRLKKAEYIPPPDLVYATVVKTREDGKVAKIEIRTIFGTDEQVAAALEGSTVSRTVNTSFVERQNGTDRNRCSRKVRKSYGFSKNWDVHRAATCLTMYSYNCCWSVRTLKRPDGKKGKCTPAMAAGLADHVWTMKEWLTYPARQ
jgi:IS1 family transposase